MRVLLVGSGGREHAIAKSICQSPLLKELYAAPGNPGIAQLATCINIKVDNVKELIHFAKEKQIDLVIPGPEACLIAGLADECHKAGILCAGPTKKAAQLEGSKIFTKEIANAAGIPTARWKRFDKKEGALEDAIAWVKKQGAPIVIKEDGLAAGKGVTVAQTIDEALTAIKKHGFPLVIEECLTGREVSLFAFCDGERAVLLGAARDYKRIYDNDKGPNTGGMGAICPPPDFTLDDQKSALDIAVKPMLKEMVKRNISFRGIIFAGLMLTDKGPYLIEYNVRLGDPEAEALLPLIETDMLQILYNMAKGDLTKEIKISNKTALALVIAAKGYPDSPKKGGVITGLDDASKSATIFQAGTIKEDHQLKANGGRVLTLCAIANTPSEARKKAYEAAEKIIWTDKYYRKDIGL